MSESVPFWLAGRQASSGETYPVHSPYDGRELAMVAVPTPEQVEEAVAAADAVTAEAAGAPGPRARRRPGPRVAPAGRARRGARPPDHRRERQAAQVVARRGRPGGRPRSAGRPRRRAGGAVRCSGSTPTLPRPAGSPSCGGSRAGRCSASRRSTSRSTWWRTRWRPAIAVGAPIVVKPAPATPLSALLLGELLAETDLPAGMFSVLPVPNDRAAGAGRRPAAAGRLLHRVRAGRLRDPGRRAAQARHARARRQRGGRRLRRLPTSTGRRPRIATFSNYQAGQSCISVQRVLVERSVYDEPLAAPRRQPSRPR